MPDIGRPPITEEQYHKWMDDLTPFLKLGETLSEAIADAGLMEHRTTLYEKSKLGDWFSDQVITYRKYPGRLANKIILKRVMLVEDKMNQGLPISRDEMADVRFVAERHRSSLSYYGDVLETLEEKDDKVLAGLQKLRLEIGPSDYSGFADYADEQETKNQIGLSPALPNPEQV